MTFVGKPSLPKVAGRFARGAARGGTHSIQPAVRSHNMRVLSAAGFNDTELKRTMFIDIDTAISQHAARRSGQNPFPLKLAPDWHQRSSENKKVSRRKPADFGVLWLPDLGSNQGPTD